MKIDPSLKQAIRTFSHFMHRYHVTLFVIVVLGGLSVATFLLYQVATAAASPDSKVPATSFDKATIERISKLHGADDTPAPLALPPGRTNPFQD